MSNAPIARIYGMGEQEPGAYDAAEFADGCRRAWHEKRIIVLRAEDRQEMPALVRMNLDAWAIGRWGKRNGEVTA